MKLDRKQLVRTAVRENNTKRPYLLVNPSQGKHVPVAPHTALQLFSALAEQVQEQVGTTAPVLIIAFAETATAIGAAVAAKLRNLTVFMQTTREVTDPNPYLCFSETHSHAAEQYMTRDGLGPALRWAEHVVFVEDEVTTGNTILHLMNVLNEQYETQQVTFGVASILNGMTEESRERYAARGIWTRYLLHTDNAAMERMLEQYNCQGDKYPVCTAYAQAPDIVEIWGMPNIRSCAWRADAYQQACAALARTICNTVPTDAQNILVLGTEECMYPGLWAGYQLEQRGYTVRFHATTRSPIQPSTEPDYPLHSRYTLQSLYDSNRVTYIYDLTAYDYICIVTDAPEPQKNGLSSLLSALEQAGNTRMTVFHWKSEYWRSI